MKLGTVVYEGKMYNLDYMSLQELQDLLTKIEENKKQDFSQGKNITKRARA